MTTEYKTTKDELHYFINVLLDYATKMDPMEFDNAPDEHKLSQLSLYNKMKHADKTEKHTMVLMDQELKTFLYIAQSQIEFWGYGDDDDDNPLIYTESYLKELIK